MSYILGLTGPTGAGKSVFSECAKEAGFFVIDCDAVARDAVKKGMPALKALTNVFGTGILKDGGELDRRKLAEVAFSSPEKTELLNKTVLPFIKKMIIKRIKGDYVLLDAPTLFESETNLICNATVAVIAPPGKRRARIMERDGIGGSAADMRMSAGKPDEFYYKMADTVIENNETVENFKKKVKIYLSDIIGGNNNERLQKD